MLGAYILGQINLTILSPVPISFLYFPLYLTFVIDLPGSESALATAMSYGFLRYWQDVAHAMFNML